MYTSKYIKSFFKGWRRCHAILAASPLAGVTDADRGQYSTHYNDSTIGSMPSSQPLHLLVSQTLIGASTAHITMIVP